MAKNIFGEATAPVTAVGRNWKSMRLAALLGGVSLVAFVWWTTSGPGTAEKKEELAPGSSTTTERMTMPDFESGYARKPVVAPAIVATPTPPPSALPVPPPPPPPAPPPPPLSRAMPPQPAKPMLSMFTGESDPEAAAYWQKNGASQEGGMPGQQRGEYRPGMDDGNGNRLPDGAGQAMAAQKNQWLASAGTGGDDFVRTPYMPPISREMIQAGTIIRGTLLNAVNSDLPGDFVISISQDIYDTPTGRIKLIPAAAKLYCRYGNSLSYGADRLQTACLRLLMPDGSSQNLGAMASVDASGASGIEGDVNRHPWQMAGAIGLSAVLSVVSQAGQLFADSGGNGQVNYAQVGTTGAGQATSSIGQQLVSRELNRSNTIELKPGMQAGIMMSKDLALPPYKETASYGR